jgi:hypothetical protein
VSPRRVEDAPIPAYLVDVVTATGKRFRRVFLTDHRARRHADRHEAAGRTATISRVACVPWERAR